MRTGRIDYILQPTTLTGANGYVPVVQYNQNRGTDYLIQEIAKRTAVSSPTVKMVISALSEVIPKELSEGNIVTINDLVSFRPVLRGSTNDPDFVVTTTNAKLVISARADDVLRLVADGLATYRKLTYETKTPVITSVFDPIDKTPADLVSTGMIIRISGENLKPVESGIAGTGVLAKDSNFPNGLEVIGISRWTDTTIEFLVPAAPNGNSITLAKPFTFEVNTVYTKKADGSFGDIRTGSFTVV